MLKIEKGKIVIEEPVREPFTAITVLEEAGTFIFYYSEYSCTKIYQQIEILGAITYWPLHMEDRILSCICEDDTLYYIDEEPVFYA